VRYLVLLQLALLFLSGCGNPVAFESQSSSLLSKAPPFTQEVPPAPTVVPPAPTVAPPAPTVVPPAPTVVPPAPTVVPPAPTVVPPAPTVVPPAPTVAPPAPTVAPPAPTIVPPAPTLPPNPSAVQVFQQNDRNENVDILFISDNSSSMEVEQEKLGRRFSSFIRSLFGVQWQIGITTTDLSMGIHSTNGNLLRLTGANNGTWTPPRILVPSMSNQERIFADTVQRPETAGCAGGSDCPSTNEEPLGAMLQLFAKRNRAENSGFIRNNADMAVVIISDEDEMSQGGRRATKPVDVINEFNRLWPTNKKLAVYGIVVPPGDEACLTEQRRTGPEAFYGRSVAELAQLTGGAVGSICETDYSNMLGEIGESVRRLLTSVQLDRDPIASSVRVEFEPAQSTPFIVRGRRVEFERAPARGTQIRVTYEYEAE
jgi:hypothetical protein